MDWIEEFKSKSLEEMEREIKAYKYYLPTPWYRWWAQAYFLISFAGGLALSFVGLLCLVVSTSFILLLLGGVAFFTSSFGFLALYDRISSDPLSIMVEGELIREGLESGNEYSDIDKPSGYMIEGVR